MVSPDIFTASRDLSKGRDTVETAAYAALHGEREGLLNKYSGYAYTEALANKILHNGNPIKAMKDVNKEGYYNFRNPVEAAVACVQSLKKQAQENANNGNQKPGNPPGPLIPLEHGAFFGEMKKVDSAINAWNDPKSRPTVRLIYDRKLGDPGSIRFSDMRHKFSEDPQGRC